MAQPRNGHQEPGDQRRRDIPHLIKWIILIFLVLLLLAELLSGEYDRLTERGFGFIGIVLLLKLLLIAIVILLMRVQRRLFCAITEPTGCTEEEPDTVNGKLIVKVKGSAYGSVFGHYTVDIQKDGDPPIAGIVSYPGGTSVGSAPVINGELATVDTTALSDGAYTLTLTVHPAGPGQAKQCQHTFNLLKVAVWINRVSGVEPTPHIFDENAELISGGEVRSFGGSLSIDGSAYIYECAGRKVKSVEMRYAPIPTPGSEPAQPANNTPIPGAWPNTNQLASPLIYDPTKYYPWTRIGVAPQSLLNQWGSCTVFGTTYPKLVPLNWQSRNATGGPADGGGEFSLLLATEDTAGNIYYDIQKVWVDNFGVKAKIVKFQRLDEGVWVDIPTCTDILISWGRLRIIGIAWDSLIDADFPPAAPNDNFEQYSMNYSKQFVPGSVSLITSSSRVPSPADYPLTVPGPALAPAPADADARLLVEWDLTTLDAGPPPTPGNCPNPAGQPHGLHRGCECTYILSLGVSDKTITESVGEYNIHHPAHFESMKIINDL